LISPIVAVVGIGRLLGHNLVASFIWFSGTNNQIDFGIAWRVIPTYFWLSEHFVAVLWGIGLAAAIGWAVTGRANQRVRLWLWTVLALYALTVVPSDAFRGFTISARNARVLAPFFCLLCAALMAEAWRRWPRQRWVVVTVTSLWIVQAGWNFARPLAQMFPKEFRTASSAFINAARRHRHRTLPGSELLFPA